MVQRLENERDSALKLQKIEFLESKKDELQGQLRQEIDKYEERLTVLKQDLQHSYKEQMQKQQIEFERLSQKYE